MKKSLSPKQLAFCSWSTRPETPSELIERCEQTGIKRVQLGMRPLYTMPDAWADAPRQFADAGIEIVSGMFAARGEDYSSLARIRKTGGIVPDETWEGNWEDLQQVAAFGKELGLKLVSTHAGFIPEDENDPKFPVVVDRIQKMGDLFKEAFGGELMLETGQETADTLLTFLGAVGRPNVGVNFDPANMLIYRMGDPVDSMRKLMSRIGQVHIKDAVRGGPDDERGAEVRVGEGEVDWPAFVAALVEAGYTGNLVIEREKGEQRVEDIRRAAEFITRHMESG